MYSNGFLTPFKTTWPELAGACLRWPWTTASDRVAWTTGGEQQADRYDLSKQVDKIAVLKMSGGRLR